jgi:hypothetical protein
MYGARTVIYTRDKPFFYEKEGLDRRISAEMGISLSVKTQ